MNEKNNENGPSPWISTFTGKKYHYFDPQPEMICLEDIAHALSNMCRFTGHVREFYSVAEHSVHAARVIEDPKLRKFALMHDAAEAYMVDIPRPFKPHLHIHMPTPEGLTVVPYKAMEEATMLAIADALGFKWRKHKEVKAVDNRLLATEWRALIGDRWEGPIPGGIVECGEPYPELQRTLSTSTMMPRDAEASFLLEAERVLSE